MFSLRIFVPTLASSITETKFSKSIKVIRRRNNRHDVANKSIQTELGDRRDGGNDVGNTEKGENEDVEGKETPLLNPEKIDYILKIESLG